MRPSEDACRDSEAGLESTWSPYIPRRKRSVLGLLEADLDITADAAQGAGGAGGAGGLAALLGGAA